MSDSLQSKTCQIHTNENIILFCYQHGTALCERCFRDKHKKCSPVTKIGNTDDECMQQKNGGVPLEDIEARVHNLSLILDEMLEDKNKNMANLVEKGKTIKETIEQARTRINNYLDELERSLELEIKVNHDKLTERIEKGKYQVKSKQSGLKAVLNDITAVKRQTNHATLYQEIQLIQSKQKDIESSVMSLLTDDKYFVLHLKLSEPVFTFERFILTLGEIVISEKSMDSSKDLYNRFKTNGRLRKRSKSAGELKGDEIPTRLNGYEAGTLTLVSCFPTSKLGKGVKIFRACFLPDNKVMLAGYQEKTLYVCNKSGEECKKVRIANFPGGITIYNRSCALVSAWQHGVQKIDLGKLTAGSVIKFHGECSAISSVRGQICVKNGVDHLKIVDINGKTIRKMPTMHNPWEVHINDIGSVFYSNLDNSDVHCVFPDGSNYLTYSSSELLDPAGLTLDNQDNLYITGFGSDNIHRISGDREVKEIVLSKDDGISSPSGITFNKQTNELLVINEDFTSIRIYKVHMT